MVNLQLPLRHIFQVDETSAAIFLDGPFLNIFGKACSTAEATELLLRWVGKPVGRDLAAIGGGDAKSFKLNAQFPNVTRGSRRMIITIFIF